MIGSRHTVKRKETKKEGAKILPFRRNININIGIVIYVFIFLYLVYSLYHYATRKTYATYQIGLPGTLSESSDHLAVILRDELPVYAMYSGYVNLYVQENTRVSMNTIIATIDEVGTYTQVIRDAQETLSLNESQLQSLKGQLKNVSANYDPQDFSGVYTQKNSISSFFLTAVSSSSLASLEQSASLAEFFHRVTNNTTGLISYYKDGFEEMRATSLSASSFDIENYSRSSAGTVVNKGDFLYKICNSENWNLVFPLSTEEVAEYTAAKKVNVTFLSNGLNTTADVSVITGADGNFYAKLSLTRFMVQFLSDRYVRIRVNVSGETGLKIPASSVTQEEFYLLPMDYAAKGGAGSSIGFLLETGEGSSSQVQYISPRVYYEDGTYYYVSVRDLTEGAVLVKQDSEDRYTVRMTGTRKGVYQVNAGYTVFCPIDIVEESVDYYLIQKGNSRGVTSYDQILLDPQGFTSNQILN